MYGNGINNILKGLNISNVLGGLNKGLNFAQQAIPLYKKIKPILSNSKSLISMLDIINTPDNKNDNNKEKIKEIENKKTSNNQINDTLPVFFQ